MEVHSTSAKVARLLLQSLASLVWSLVALWRLILLRVLLLRLASKFPGPPSLPLLGNALDVYPRTTEAFFNYTVDLWKKFGNVYKVFMGPMFFVFTGHREDQELMLTSNEYLKKGIAYSYLTDWLGDGLLTSTGKKWRSRRKILTPAFHFNILEQFVPVFHSCGGEFVRQLRTRAGGSYFDISGLVKLATLDVICETTMGVHMNAQTNSTSEYVNAVQDITVVIYEYVVRPWLYPKFIFRHTTLGRRYQKCLDVLHGTTDRVIRERRTELEKAGVTDQRLDVDELGRRRRVAFLDLLLLSARDGSLSDADIREEVDTFMFEGHDTTSSAISFTIFLLSRHPDVQEKLLEELESVFDTSKPLEPSIQDLSQLKYLEMVIKESMRIYPPVTAVARAITSDFQMGSCPLTAPAGTDLFMSFWVLHRNPEVFPDPETFDPERFSPERCAARHPFAYLPFSAGPRNCIGQRFAMLELKSLLAKVVWNFRIFPDPDYQPTIVWELVTKTNNGISVGLEERTRRIY